MVQESSAGDCDGSGKKAYRGHEVQEEEVY